jgi:hypothetical protein
MIVVAALVLVAVSVPLAGGHLERLAEVKLRAVWAAIGALTLQIGIINVFEHSTPHAVAVAVHLLSYALAGWFVIANRRIRGLVIIAFGAALNMAAIVTNHGVMPASPTAARIAGHAVPTDKFVNSVATPDANLAFLGDVFAVPEGYPLANVFSVGDVVLVIGAAVTLHAASGSRLAHRRRPAAPHAAT